MRHYTAHQQITQVKRHYNVDGNDLLAVYDTAIAGYDSRLPLPYVTLSTSKVVWDRIAANPNIERVRHPGTGVECLKMFDTVYLRKQNRVADEDIVWSKELGCYTPSRRYLHNQFQHLLMNSKSTKKIIAYAESLIGKLQTHIKENKVKI